MRRRALILVTLLALATPAWAQVQIGAPGAGLPRTCHAGENLTVSTAAVGPTLATAAGATVVVLSHDGTANDVRFRMDGTAPTATIGLRLTGTNHPIVLVGASLIGRLQFIREDAADVVVFLEFCK
jgi:hypothetical protein